MLRNCDNGQPSKLSGFARNLLGLEDALDRLEKSAIPPTFGEVACLLHRCRKSKDESCSIRLHAYLSKSKLDDHPILGNYLVSTLIEAGLIHNAQQVFSKLPVRSEWSWYSLISGYMECCKPLLAFTLFEKMQDENIVSPAGHTIVAALKACGKLKDLERGLLVHGNIAKSGLQERDLFVGSALIDMYAKCGSLVSAQNVFEKLRMRNIVSWNALMTGYIDNGKYEAALQCFEQMRHTHVAPDAFTFVCTLKACSKVRHLQQIQALHAQIEKLGSSETDAFVNNALVDVYANCHLLVKAEQVFEKFLSHNVVAWNTLMAAYAKHGCYKETVLCFEQMQIEGVSPDAVSFAGCFRACGSMKAVQKGQILHAYIEKLQHLLHNPVIANALIDMYTNFGLLGDAQAVLNCLPQRNVAAWTALMAKYVEGGCNEDVLDCFERMQKEGIFPNAITFVYSLKACSRLRAVFEGQNIHAEIERKGILDNNVYIASILVNMYASCGDLSKAQEVFDKVLVKDLILWNALINGYAEHNYGPEALAYFDCMESEGVYPNSVTFVGGLKACGCMSASEKLPEMHAELERLGLLENDIVVGSALVDAYAKCGLLSKARQLCDKFSAMNVVLWNALMRGYAEIGCKSQVIKCFEQMQREGVEPDVFTFVTIIVAGLESMDLDIHCEIARKGYLESDSVAGNALIDMYIRQGSFTRAKEVFEKLPSLDIISWNVMISGYTNARFGEESLKIFEQMLLQNTAPNRISLVCCLKACAYMGSIEKGKEMHMEIVKRGLMDRDLVGNTLVDMYAKCGRLPTAQFLFDNLDCQDIFSCNSLIGGYSQLGEANIVFQIFDRMQREEISPNSITFIVLLNACSCIGLYDKSQMYYEVMVNEYGIVPTLQHHSCIVNLLGRLGRIEIANSLVQKSPTHPNLAVLRTILRASRGGGHVELGKQAFDRSL